jgi:hypothetical protein
MSLPGLTLAGGLPGPMNPSAPPDAALTAAAVHAFESALRREHGRRIQAVCYRQVFTHALPILTQGMSIVDRGRPVAVFHNRFPDHAAYLATLSKSRRGDQSRLIRRSDGDPDVTVHFGPVPPEFDLKAFHTLAEETARRNHLQRWPPLRRLPEQLYAAQAAVPGAKVMQWVESTGRLLGCTIIFDHPVAPLAGPWGSIDPRHGGRTGIWFEYYARTLRWVIESKRSSFIGGKAFMAQKAELGFEAVPQWTVLRRLGRA